jgi:hypothetical protein
MKEQFYGKEGKDPPPKYHGGRFVSNVVKEKIGGKQKRLQKMCHFKKGGFL